MATLEDDQAELENCLLSNWQPVKMMMIIIILLHDLYSANFEDRVGGAGITKCRCYSIELALPHYESCS